MSTAKDDESVERRIVRYEYGIQRCAYIGAGYGGVFLLTGFAGDRVWSNAWWWVVPVLAVVVSVGVFLLGWAYLMYASALRKLRLTPPPLNAGPYPGSPQAMYLTALMILGLVTVAVIVATWVVLAPHGTPTPHPTGVALFR